MSACTSTCWTPVECRKCGRPKSPVGRSVGLEAANGYCNDDCPWYRGEPKPPHLWSEHDSTRSYTDLEGWQEHLAHCEQCRYQDE